MFTMVAIAVSVRGGKSARYYAERARRICRGSERAGALRDALLTRRRLVLETTLIVVAAALGARAPVTTHTTPHA